MVSPKVMQYLSEAGVNAHTVSVLHFLLPKR